MTGRLPQPGGADGGAGSVALPHLAVRLEYIWAPPGGGGGAIEFVSV